jgi:N-acetylmuramoyl-L-alanine amidase
MASQTQCLREGPDWLPGGWLRSAVMLFALVMTMLTQAMAASADDEVLEAVGYKMAGDSSRMRIVVQFDREPELRWLMMGGPHRLVFDISEAAFGFDEAELQPRGMVTDVRHGNLGTGSSRIIVSFDTAFEVERIDILENEASPGYRLVADVVASSQKAFDAALALQVETTASTRTTPKGDRLGGVGEEGAGRFRIVIDAGHGGIDTGAKGVSGTLEKTITLAFALELKKKLDDLDLYDVFLTRDHDLFLMLDDRVRIARQHEADLLISIHADAIRLKSVRGATVYTVADKASDAEAAAKAVRENLADEIAGIKIEEEHEEVADILADLIRRETQTFSIRFARSLVGKLSTSIQMIPTNPHRFAGFKVLKAPDVPSVLLELGYLSNADDETQLRDPEWRARASDAIADSIRSFASRRQGAGG